MNPLLRKKTPVDNTTNTGSVPATTREIQQLLIAARAAKLLSRPPIIAALSGLPLAKSRKIYRDITERDPTKGQLPSDTTFYISDPYRHLESAWLAQTYRMLSKQNDGHYEQCKCMFLAYEQYLAEFSAPTISFDRFFLLIRHTFFGSEVTISTCRNCNCAKLSVKSWDPTRMVKCPMCYLNFW